MAIRKPKLLPKALVDKARELVRYPVDGDYKDCAAAWCNALRDAEFTLGVDGTLERLGMPDGSSCPRAFDAWFEQARPPAPAKKPRRRSKTWLRELATDKSRVSKWSDGYVLRLGALEHCDEVLSLHHAEAVAKAEGRKGTYASAIERELADLWCILEMNRQADPAFATLCAERAWKFKP